jgi:hypothetical protein
VDTLAIRACHPGSYFMGDLEGLLPISTMDIWQRWPWTPLSITRARHALPLHALQVATPETFLGYPTPYASARGSTPHFNLLIFPRDSFPFLYFLPWPCLHRRTAWGVKKGRRGLQTTRPALDRFRDDPPQSYRKVGPSRPG